MVAVILKCRPGSRFHLGQSAMRQNETLTSTAEIIHSDVLFGGFINAAAQRFPDRVDTWKNYFETGQIRFSSAFYCLGSSGKYIYLLPKPISLNTMDFSEDEKLRDAHKKLKKVSYLSRGVWEKQLLQEEWFREDGLCFLPEKRAVALKEELGEKVFSFKLSEKTDTQKVKVRTPETTGNLYSQTDLVLMGNKDIKVHWYFMIEMDALSPEEQKNAKRLIEDLATQGIGGERSTGCGHIQEIEYDDNFSLPAESNSDQFMTVSLTIPKEDEKDKLLAYQVVQRGGMYYGNEEDNRRLKMINALAEGAVLSSEISGRIADLSDENKIHWRGGVCFCVSLPDAYSLKELRQ